MLKLIQPATVEPITLDDVKTHSRIVTTLDDDYIAELIQAGRQKWEKETGYFLSAAEYEYTTTGKCIRLPLRPVLSVESVNDLAEEDYELHVDPATGIGTVELLASVAGEVVITFKVGFINPEDTDDPEAPHAAPALAKIALKQLVSHFYESREAFAQGDLKAVPASWESIVRTYRIA